MPRHPGDIPAGTLAWIEADLAPAFGMTDRADDALDDFDLDVRYDIGDSSTAVAAARRARVDAERAERASADAIRRAVAGLPASLSIRDVAELLGISHQRVAQVRAELFGTGRTADGRRAYAGG